MKTAKQAWAIFLYLAAYFVCLGQAPLNDHFTNAFVLSGNSAGFSGTSVEATDEPGEPCCRCPGSGGSVWWSWTSTNSTAVLIEPVRYNPFVYGSFCVSTGTNLAGLTQVNCNYLDLIPHRYVSFFGTAGTRYYIRVTCADPFSLQLTATNSPRILGQPPSQAIEEDSSVLFAVTGAGVPPLTYQWHFAGNALPGQTAPTLLLHHVTPTQAGLYSVIVGSATGTATSAPATLVISAADPTPKLAVINIPNTNRFYFTVAGRIGQRYQIEGTSNLRDWTEEQSLGFYYGDPGVVLATNEISAFSFERTWQQKFLRASHHVNPEICSAQLRQIDFAIKLWAVETSRDESASVTSSDVLSYMVHAPVCPSGGTIFEDSYLLYRVNSGPKCMKVPPFHVQ